MYSAATYDVVTACINEAARLIRSETGAADRLLAHHRAGHDGRCSGCGRSVERWPCVLVAIAHRAQELDDPVVVERRCGP